MKRVITVKIEFELDERNVFRRANVHLPLAFPDALADNQQSPY